MRLKVWILPIITVLLSSLVIWAYGVDMSIPGDDRGRAVLIGYVFLPVTAFTISFVLFTDPNDLLN